MTEEEMPPLRPRSVVLLSLIYLATAAPSAWAAKAPTGEVTLTARTDRRTVPVDETATLTVAVEWRGAADRYRFGWPEAPQTYRLSIVGSKRGSRSWIDDEGQHSRQEFSFILEPQVVGKASVGGIRLTYWDTADTSRGGATLTTMPISLEVVPSARSEGRIPWADVGIALAVTASVGVAVWWLRSRRRSYHCAPVQGTPPLPDELDETLAGLCRARERRDVPEFYGEAMKAVRLALRRALTVETARLTSDELTARLSETGWSSEVQSSLRELLERIDRRRFAPFQPEESEWDETEQTVRRLVELTRPRDTDDAVRT